MKIFQATKKFLGILGITANQPYNKKIYCGFLIFCLSIVLHILNILIVASNFMEYIECISTTYAIVVVTTSYFTIVFNKEKLFEILDSTGQLVCKRIVQCPTSKKLFGKTNNIVEKCSETIYFVVVKVSPQCVIYPKCIISYFLYFATDMGRDSFELPFPIWFPFDSENPIGYLIAVTLQYVLVVYEFSVIACSSSLVIGGFLLAISFAKDVKRAIHRLNKMVKAKENQIQIFEQFSQIIYAYSTVKQFTRGFSDIFQPVCMMLFSWSLVAICGAMLVIRIEISHHEYYSTGLMVTAFVACYSFCTLFMACEVGQRIEGAFGQLEHILYQCNWYSFSNELKRMLPTTLFVLQQPVSYECFGSISCTREVFKQVVNSAFSYFMMLRQFNN